jgi:hypothetical protein
MGGGYKTADGIIADFQVWLNGTDSAKVEVRKGNSEAHFVTRSESGWPLANNTDGLKTLQWKGYIAIGSDNSSDILNARAYETAEYEAKVKELAGLRGIV